MRTENPRYARVHELRLRSIDGQRIARCRALDLNRPVTDAEWSVLTAASDPAPRDVLIARSARDDAAEAFAALERDGLIFRVEGVLDRPIIILSTPRAGSTLLFETLGNARDLWTVGGESHSIMECLPRLTPPAREYESHCLSADDADPETSERLHTAFLTHTRDRDARFYRALAPEERPRSLRLLEKTPRNLLRIPFLNSIFPDARFIFLHRSAGPCISSLIEAWRAPGFWQFKRGVPGCELPGWDREEWCMLLPPGWRSMKGRSLEEIAAFQWRVSNALALDALDQLPPDRWTSIAFEDFLADPAAETERLCAFADIPFDETLASAVARPLSASSSTVTPPRRDKWRENEQALARVMPSVRGVQERLFALSNLADTF